MISPLKVIFYLPLLLILNFNTACSSAHNDSKTGVRYADTIRIKSDLIKITSTRESRNYLNVNALNEVAEYLYLEFLKLGDSVSYQKYTVEDREYKNVIFSIGTQNRGRIIVGAHYDVCGIQSGADDNASGVTGLLELARLLSKEKQNYRIDFVAYTLEEPPFFKTEKMGSYVHAKSLFDSNVKIKGMICLEMIGYFNDEPESQEYPLGFLKWFYGNKGNFVTVVGKFGDGKFGRSIKNLMKKQKLIITKSFKGPASLPGVDFSDHLNYWKFNYKAVMVTNTAFYRNKNYHKTTDIIETLDIGRMGLVIDELYLTLKNFK
jgi:Zn-dependent M28 family amino/carboxypeptidase